MCFDILKKIFKDVKKDAEKELGILNFYSNYDDPNEKRYYACDKGLDVVADVVGVKYVRLNRKYWAIFATEDELDKFEYLLSRSF